MQYFHNGAHHLVVERAKTLERLIAKLKARYFYTSDLTTIEHNGQLKLVSTTRELGGYTIVSVRTRSGRPSVYCLKSLGPNAPRRPKKPRPADHGDPTLGAIDPSYALTAIDPPTKDTP